MSIVKFLIIGDLPLATQVFRLLHSHPQVEIGAVITMHQSIRFLNDPWEDNTCLYDEVQKHDYRVFHDLEEVVEKFGDNYFDFGISCRASIIYRAPFLRLFRRFLINMHGGILPRRSGLHIANHSIIEGDQQSGGTLHVITEGIDTGPILARKSFDIENTDTSFEVYRKTQISLLKAFSENLDGIISGRIEPVPQSVFIEKGEEKTYFNKKAIDKRKEVSLKDIDLSQLDCLVRGLDFPGREPAFTIINGNKIYLTTQPFFRKK